MAAAGEALPAVNIVAVHEPSGTVYGTSTRDDGRYNLPNLRTGGPYTVTATLVGYRKQTRGQIILQLSENFDLNFTWLKRPSRPVKCLSWASGHPCSMLPEPEPQPTFCESRSTDFLHLPQLPGLLQGVSVHDGDGECAGTKTHGTITSRLTAQIFNDIFGLGSTGAPAGQSTVTTISLERH